MSRPVPVLRSPQIAPVYALVLAFAAVGAASWLFGMFSDRPQDPGPDHPAITVTVSGDDLPADLAISVDGAKGIPVGASPVRVPAGARTLCLQSTAPVRMVRNGKPTGCVPATEPRVRVERVVVRVTSASDLPQGLVLTVGGDAVPLDDEGRYTPTSSIEGRSVCVAAPIGWKVVAPKPGADGPSCTTAPDALTDVAFTVAEQ